MWEGGQEERGSKPSMTEGGIALSLAPAVYKYSSSPSLGAFSFFPPTHSANSQDPRRSHTSHPLTPRTNTKNAKNATTSQKRRHHALHASLLQVREHHCHLHQLLRLRPRRVPDLRLGLLVSHRGILPCRSQTRATEDPSPCLINRRNSYVTPPIPGRRAPIPRNGSPGHSHCGPDQHPV